MPKKRSHGGEQEYIPAGNGLASGTYASDDGNNSYHTGGQNTDKVPPRHFKKFSKDANKDKENKDGGNQIKPKEQETKGLYTPKKQYTEQEMTTIIQTALGVSKITDNVKAVIEQLNGKNINPEIRGLVLDTLARGYTLNVRKNKSGFYNDWTKVISFASNQDKSYANGGVAFHECGHALDYTYKDSNGHRGLWSRDYVSKKYGKSLIEMKNEELNEFLSNGGFEKIKQELQDDKVKINEKNEEKRIIYYNLSNNFDKLIDEREEWLDNYDDFKSLSTQLKENRQAYRDNKIGYFEYVENNDKIKNEIEKIRKTYPKNNEIEEARTKRDNAYKEYANVDGELGQKYIDFSDMLQAIDNQYKFLGGHNKNYFTNSWDGEQHKATECFAEIQSAIGTNPKSLELLQRHIPKTIEIYKEILGELSNGR